MENGKTIGEQNIYTTQIINLLEKAEYGDIVTYQEMEDEIKMDVRPMNPGYRYQYSARAILERDADIVFEVVKKTGLKRLAPEQVAKSSLSAFTSPMKSHLRRQKRRVSTIDDSYHELEQDSRFVVDITRTMIAFTDKFTNRKSIKMLTNKITETSRKLKFRETLSLFEPKK